MKGSVARKIRQEMEKYRQQPNTPIVPLHDRVFSPLGSKGEVLVPVNHIRRAKREIQRVGDLNQGIKNYGAKLVNTIMENREAQGDINALDKLALSRQEKKARKMSRGAIASAMKKKTVYTEKQPKKPDVIFTPEELSGKIDQMVEYVSNAIPEKKGMYDGPFVNMLMANTKDGKIVEPYICELDGKCE